MKELLLGILFIIILGFGGLVYRNAIEHPTRSIACPLDALLCPDGTSVARTGNSCAFLACPLPNVSLSNINISFALPEGLVSVGTIGEESIASYSLSISSSTDVADIIIRRYAISASSTAFSTIKQTAISTTSELPIAATSFTSIMIGNRRFTVVTIDRSEGIIDTAYYMARGTDVLRFDAIDKNVVNWTDANLDISSLPAHSALAKLLATLQGG